MLNNENAYCYINYVMSGHTITNEIIEKLNYEDLLQHANELGEFTKENLIIHVLLNSQRHHNPYLCNDIYVRYR